MRTNTTRTSYTQTPPPPKASAKDIEAAKAELVKEAVDKILNTASVLMRLRGESGWPWPLIDKMIGVPAISAAKSSD